MANDMRDLNLVGSIEARSGVYANAVLITTREEEDILDFIFIDSATEGNSATGVLESRVIMTRKTLLALRETIDRHLTKSEE